MSAACVETSFDTAAGIEGGGDAGADDNALATAFETALDSEAVSLPII